MSNKALTKDLQELIEWIDFVDGPVRGEHTRKQSKEIITKAIAALETQEWVSVEDRLPGENELVIVAGGVAVCRRGEWITQTGHSANKPIQWKVPLDRGCQRCLIK